MTDKQAVIDALRRLPENASLDEITQELHLMAAIRRGREDIAAGRAKPHHEVKVIGQSSLVGTPRCGVRTAQRAVPTFPEFRH